MPNFANTGPDTGAGVVQGLQAFSDSVNQLAMRQSLQNAQSQIDNINDTTENEFQRYQQYRQVGQQLAFQMAGAGADAAHINTVVGAIPKPAPLPQNALEGITSENPAVNKATTEYMAQVQKNEIAKLQTSGDYRLAQAGIAAKTKADSDTKKAEADSLKTFNKQIESFGSQKTIAPLLIGRDAVDVAQKQLAQAKGNPAAFVSSAIAALRAAGLQRITEFELKKMGDSLGLAKKFATMSANSIGNVSDNDIHAVQKVLDVLKESNQTQLKDKAMKYADTLGSSPGAKFTPQQYYNQLHTAHFDATESMPMFDSSGRFSKEAPAAAPGTSAPQAPTTPKGAFGIPGFTLR